MNANIWKSVGAIVAGFVAVFVLSYGTDALLGMLGVLNPGPLPLTGSEALVGSILLYRSVYNAFGCYLAARLAPNRPMGHGLMLGGLGFVLSLLGALTGQQALGPAWYSWSLAIFALPCAWLGSTLAARHPTRWSAI